MDYIWNIVPALNKQAGTVSFQQSTDRWLAIIGTSQEPDRLEV